MSDTRPQGQPDEAMVDLLVKQVTEGLSPAEQRALDVMDSELASAYLAGSGASGRGGHVGRQQRARSHCRPLSSARIAQQAAEHFARPSKVTDSSEARIAAAEERPFVQSSAPARANRFGNYGWLAAAACLVLAIFGWERSPPPPVAVVTPAPVTCRRPSGAPAREARRRRPPRNARRCLRKPIRSKFLWEPARIPLPQA